MTELCILYCLHKRDLTIYSVRKRISELFGAFTKPSHGTIYPALKKLTDEGCVTVSETLSDGGKKSSFFSITEKGKKRFVELMTSDFSDNPSVFLNELNIRISSMGVLNSAIRQICAEKCLKYADLYITTTERTINDEYSGVDDFQKAVMKNSVDSLKQLIKVLNSLE